MFQFIYRVNLDLPGATIHIPGHARQRHCQFSTWRCALPLDFSFKAVSFD
ncbi:hypothetical protein [Pseudomonas fluorescens]|uniref:Uncharacterized protein n=1 Tax=Pseudomonas fluorescens TaxID=294 RepID=A0A5E7E841_PSEFL|nr:hypothetical protein [Pseudomonas fluorescens]VVO22772.1 hypothetical protein PS710_04375 [Pseudomonas fluorescens]